MIIEHKFNKKRIIKEVHEEVGFLISNRKGGFFSQGISSIYGGLFFKNNGGFFKTIDEIRIKEKVTEIKNNFWNVERKRGKIKEEFFMPIGKEVLACELNKKENVEFILDIKKPYDNRDWGRNYKVTEENGKVLVKFIKKTDQREDTSHDKKEYCVYLAIACSGKLNYKLIDGWEKKHFSFDKNRNMNNYERYVYKAIDVSAKRFVISFSLDKEECLKQADEVLKNFNKHRGMAKKIDFPGKNMEEKCANKSLFDLMDLEVNDIYAGFPWFFQFWSRDSLISLKALMLNKKNHFVKNLLDKYLQNISNNGLLPNRVPGTVTNSADSIGWLGKRILDYDDMFSEITSIENLKKGVDILFKETTQDSLVYNEAQETWMDSIERGGFRIEIQLLRIVLYDLLFKKNKSKVYKQLRDKTVNKTREFFFKDGYLYDGKDDSTIRPNLFIAAYLYPELLSKDEWNNCFDIALEKLWLEWGGISTVDITSNQFIGNSTGHDSTSYHNGDSWYWLNNLVGIVLMKNDKKRYKKYIDKIYEASKEEILYKGFIGCHSEISSAFIQESNGCLNQAWSNAMFIEFSKLKN